MDALEYYNNIFGPELKRIGEGPYFGIRVVYFYPQSEFAGPFDDEQFVAFHQTPSKRLFLFCYFFSALLDQAIHSGLSSEHRYFDKIAKYPKLMGVLSACDSILHPDFLLLIATLYITEKDEEEATKEFNQLADFFTEDYCDFFEEKYPKITGRLQNIEDRKNACKAVLEEIQDGISQSYVPRVIDNWLQSIPNKILYRKWSIYFFRKISAKLEEYKG